MAKPTKSTGTSRIKFIMFDAEIADDQIPMVTQAITNALRGPHPAPKRLPPAAPLVNGAEHVEEPDLFDDVEEVDTVDVTPAAPKTPRKKRVGPKPNMIPIDVDSEPKLSSLVDGKSNHKRYLTIAAWLHDHRGTPQSTSSGYRRPKKPSDEAKRAGRTGRRV